MARIIGSIPINIWERRVREDLSDQLPDDWTVICGVSWSARNENGWVRDGQSDFVVLAPYLGMLVIEVKGSKEVRVDQHGVWHRVKYLSSGVTEEYALRESPPDQATRNLHEIKSFVCKDLGWGDTFRGAFGYLVLYPNGKILGATHLLDPTTYLGKAGVSSYRTIIKKCLIARGAEQASKYFTQETCTEISKSLTKQGFVVHASGIDEDLERQTEELERLTRQQAASLKGIFQFPRVAIRGPAGSGKTILGIWRLRAELDSGRKAMYVCYNKALASHLKLKNPECARYIFNVDSLFMSMCKGAVNAPGQSSDKNAFFDSILPNQVAKLSAFYGYDEKYDSIIIDEGQDFGEERLIALFDLLRETDSSWLLLSDWSQDIYQRGENLMVGAEILFGLSHNCRNTRTQVTATNKICNMNVESFPDAPNGTPPIVELVKTRSQNFTRAFEHIKKSSPDGTGVILGPYSLPKSSLADARQSSYLGLKLTEDISLLGEKGYVFYSTIKSFKGLEAKFVVLIDLTVSSLSEHIQHSDLYVALTRSTVQTIVLTQDQQSHTRFVGKPS